VDEEAVDEGSNREGEERDEEEEDVEDNEEEEELEEEAVGLPPVREGEREDDRFGARSLPLSSAAESSGIVSMGAN
jgi:hypothetical protein